MDMGMPIHAYDTTWDALQRTARIESVHGTEPEDKNVGGGRGIGLYHLEPKTLMDRLNEGTLKEKDLPPDLLAVIKQTYENPTTKQARHNFLVDHKLSSDDVYKHVQDWMRAHQPETNKIAEDIFTKHSLKQTGDPFLAYLHWYNPKIVKDMLEKEGIRLGNKDELARLKKEPGLRDRIVNNFKKEHEGKSDITLPEEVTLNRIDRWGQSLPQQGVDRVQEYRRAYTGEVPLPGYQQATLSVPTVYATERFLPDNLKPSPSLEQRRLLGEMSPLGGQARVAEALAAQPHAATKYLPIFGGNPLSEQQALINAVTDRQQRPMI